MITQILFISCITFSLYAKDEAPRQDTCIEADKWAAPKSWEELHPYEMARKAAEHYKIIYPDGLSCARAQESIFFDLRNLSDFNIELIFTYLISQGRERWSSIFFCHKYHSETDKALLEKILGADTTARELTITNVLDNHAKDISRLAGILPKKLISLVMQYNGYRWGSIITVTTDYDSENKSRVGKIDLSKRLIEQVDISHPSMNNINELDLSNNLLTEIPPTIYQLSRLAKLDLEGNNIPHSDLEKFQAWWIEKGRGSIFFKSDISHKLSRNLYHRYYAYTGDYESVETIGSRD